MNQIQAETRTSFGNQLGYMPPLHHETRILLCERQTMVREGIRKLLESEPSLRVVGEVANGHDAIRYALAIRPDVVLLEIDLDGLDGLSAARAILHEAPKTKVILLSNLHHHVMKAVEAGAQAFLLKAASASDLIDSVKRVAAGEILLGTMVAPVDNEAHPKPRDGHSVTLTNSEKNVLRLLLSGSSNYEIARALNLSEKTVRNKLSNLYSKLQVHNRTQAALYAVGEGLTGVGGAQT